MIYICPIVCIPKLFVVDISAQHLQRTPAAGVVLPAGVGGWASGAASALQAKLRLQSLQMERERLKQRQQEIRLHVQSLHFIIPSNHWTPAIQCSTNLGNYIAIRWLLIIIHRKILSMGDPKEDIIVYTCSKSRKIIKH